MDFLIIGGTMFLGRHIVASALRDGHAVTMFTRGKTNPDLFPEAEHVIGDRDGGLDPLRRRTFDAVIDTCGYFPRVVRQSAELLADATEHYTFVSSISVYAEPPPGTKTIDESSPVATIEDPSIEQITNESYGALKALCENEVSNVFGARALIVRPGLIVGPFDPTDRFTYWPRRARRGGTVLAPAGPERPTQWIDARDLAAWILRAAEARTSGTFNATAEPVPFGDVLGACVEAANNGATVEWIPEDFLLENEVGPWMELPLWVPGDDPMMNADVSKAVKDGLTFRSVLETVRDTMEWDSAQPERPARAGLDEEKERKVLEAWRARDSA